MKIKLLFLLLASCVLTLSAWLVHRNNRPEVISPNEFVTTVQGGEPNAPVQNEIQEKYRDTIHKGLEFLVKHQHKDGHWEGDDGKHPVAMTGLVGLALLMDREVREGRGKPVNRDTKYAANVRKATDWLIAMSQRNRNGLFFSDHPSETARYMQGHGLATLFLAGVFKHADFGRRSELTDVLIPAAKYISEARSTQGGWYPTSKVEGHDFADISATVIQVQALQAAENAGFVVGADEVIRHAQEYIQVALEKHQKQAKPERIRLAETAGAIACRTQTSAFGRLKPKDELLDNWVNYCNMNVSSGRDIKLDRDELIHYYFAQALFNRGGDAWKSYSTATFDYLKGSQNKDGSWPSADGICVGNVYSTAVWCIVLQLENRSHPSTQIIQTIIE